MFTVFAVVVGTWQGPDPGNVAWALRALEFPLFGVNGRWLGTVRCALRSGTTGLLKPGTGRSRLADSYAGRVQAARVRGGREASFGEDGRANGDVSEGRTRAVLGVGGRTRDDHRCARGVGSSDRDRVTAHRAYGTENAGHHPSAHTAMSCPRALPIGTDIHPHTRLRERGNHHRKACDDSRCRYPRNSIDFFHDYLIEYY